MVVKKAALLRRAKPLKKSDDIHAWLFYFTGCRLFQGIAADGGQEKGMYCYCLGDNCNIGDIAYPIPVNATSTTAAPTSG